MYKLKLFLFQLVIANMLQTRKQQVTIVSQESNHVISLTNEQLNRGEEIERLIVNVLVDRHQNFIKSTGENS